MSPRITSDELREHEARRAQPAPVKTRRAGRKERDIQRAILAYLGTVPGVVAWRNNTGAMFGEHKGKRWAVRFGRPGLSDIIGWREFNVTDGIHAGPMIHGANFLAIEVKKPGTFPSVAQQAFLDTVRGAGGLALVARSVEDVRVALGAPR